MGKMALGYGSEFHLLRILGRHRNQFNNQVEKLLGVENVYWLDFKFNSKSDNLDEEIKGLEFLEDHINHTKVVDEFKSNWPQSGNVMNWDLVGNYEINGIITWILVEAKAHLGELYQSSGASEESHKRIESNLQKAFQNLGISLNENNILTKKYYQYANRLYIIDLLRRNNISAVLLNIYFTGDLTSSSRISPKSKDEWKPKLEEMKEYLNIKDVKSLGIYELFLKVDSE